MESPVACAVRPKRPRVADENRKRAARACDGCRRQKEKCEGGVPCRRCRHHGRRCEFNSYYRDDAREADRSAVLTRNDVDVPESQRVKYMERILSHYVPGISFDIPTLQKVAESLRSDYEESENQTTSHAEGDDEDLVIDDENFTIKTLPDSSTHYSGEFSYLNFSDKIRRKIGEWVQTASPEVTSLDCLQNLWINFGSKDSQGNENQEGEAFRKATRLQSTPSVVSNAIASLPPRYVADFLVQIFFKYAQTNNFYVEEDWLRERLNTCYTQPETLSAHDAGSLCSILMVLAIGTQFAHMESGTPIDKLLVSGAGEDIRFSEDDIGLTFYQYACKLLPDIITVASVRCVQACLLVGTYLLPLDTSGLCYTYFGLALKMAVQNGMHRRYSGGDSLDPEMVEVRNRVWWTAYTIERRISILHGRPASISLNDVDVDFPSDVLSLRPKGQLSNYPNMVALITLTLKLGGIADDIAALRQCSKGQQQGHLEKFLSRRKQLSEWWSTLPDQTYCRDLNPIGGHFRSNIHLKMDYLLTRLFIGRPFLFCSQKRGTAIGNQQNGANASRKPTLAASRTTLVGDCVQAALEIVDLCQLLRDETGLARASYTEFCSCRAALLVILAQSLNQRTERLRNALTQGMGLIRIMSIGADSARSAVSVIEALERAIRRLESWGDEQLPQSRNSNDFDSGYERFKNWEMLWKIGPGSPAPVQHGGVATPIPVCPGLRTNDGDFPNTSQVSPLGFDSFVSTFPQELGEFTAIPGFDEVQNPFDGVDGANGNGEGKIWMDYNTTLL